ncbi:hypothetical protein ACFYOT_25345 [Saccharothrix saharensis]|uniref:hypothetical protein n=1 Tax=Saccharothrix saharensis TaxID=571190 RepID=UPI003679AA02
MELFERLCGIGCRLVAYGYTGSNEIEHGQSVAYGKVRAAGAHDVADLIELPMSYSDYGGSDLDAANIRAMIELFGPDAFVHLHGPHGSAGLALPCDQPLPDDLDCEMLLLLVRTVEGLRDYPLVDDCVHSTYADELAEDAWSAWLRFDIGRDLNDYAPDGDASDALLNCDEDDLQSAYYAFEGNEWVCDTATSAVNLRHDDAVRHVAAAVFGWVA